MLIFFQMTMKVKPLLLFILLLGFLIPACGKQEKPLKIHMIDVGEGDAFLIQAPSGKNILIDAGNPISGFKLVNYLKLYRVKTINHLFFSHPDQDHIGGTFFLTQHLKIKNTYDNGEDLSPTFEKSDFYYWYDRVVRHELPYQMLRAGDEIKIDGIKFEVLWPPTPLPYNWYNPNSLVLMMEWKNFKMLFTGDLVNISEKALLKTGVSLDADLLKVGHHGANDTTTLPFLKAVSPKMALVSANHDRRDYPGAAMLKKLKERNIPYCRTDLDGNVTLSITPEGIITPETQK